MNEIALLILAISVFVATNLDDLLILITFFSHKDFKWSDIVIGQYLGILSLFMFCSLAYFFKYFIPSTWISLMGIFPIIIGLKELFKLRKGHNQEESYKNVRNKMIYPAGMVASITIINGGDNIGVYIPLFANLNLLQIFQMGVVFFVLTGCWCFIGFKLVNNSLFSRRISKKGHIILPFFLIFLGIMIIVRGFS